MPTHKISIEVDESLFNFHQTILPWGDRKKLILKLLKDVQIIHRHNPRLIRKYITGEINIFQFQYFIEKEQIEVRKDG